jgi:pyruvate ferredoxin oxidoreductase gamma subunit
MQQLTEIRWHARAGQGAVTAAQLVAEIAMGNGRYMQAMPEFGPERTGAPLKAYTRLSDEPIEIHNNVVNPDIVVVMDMTLLGQVDVLEGMKPQGTIIFNTRNTPDQMRQALNVPADITVACVDATQIALDTIGRNIPNTPLVAAMARVCGVMSLQNVLDHIEREFSKKFNAKVVAGNMASVSRAFEEVVF